jgi:hypothetical protein
MVSPDIDQLTGAIHGSQSGRSQVSGRLGNSLAARMYCGYCASLILGQVFLVIQSTPEVAATPAFCCPLGHYGEGIVLVGFPAIHVL